MQGQDLLRFLQILGRWWWVMALALLATIAAIIIAITMTAPSYQAGVMIQISAPPPQEVPLFSEYGREAISQQIEQTRTSLAEFLQSNEVAAEVLERLGAITLTTNQLRERITVELPPAAQTLRVQVRADSPATAALLTTTVAEVGLDHYAQLLAQPTANNRLFIEEQLQLTADRLVAAEQQLEQFRLQHKVYNVETAIEEQNRLLLALRQNSDLARTRNNTAEVQQTAPVIAEREQELQALIQLVPEYNTLVAQVDNIRATSNLLQQSLNEAQIKESQILAGSSIQMISAARTPDQPVPVLSNGLILLAIFSSLLVGILLALLLEFMDSLNATRGAQSYRLQPEATGRSVPHGR